MVHGVLETVKRKKRRRETRKDQSIGGKFIDVTIWEWI